MWKLNKEEEKSALGQTSTCTCTEREKSRRVGLWWGKIISIVQQHFLFSLSMAHLLTPTVSTTADPPVTWICTFGKHKAKSPLNKTTKTSYLSIHRAPAKQIHNYVTYGTKLKPFFKTILLQGICVHLLKWIKFRFGVASIEKTFFIGSNYSNYTGSRSLEDSVHKGKDMLCLSAWLLTHKMWLVLAFCLKHR